MSHDRRPRSAPHRDDVLDPRAAPDPSATSEPLPATDALLALQRTAGNRAVSRFAATLQRFPEKAGNGFRDSDYKDVELAEVVKYKVYRITSETCMGTLLYHDPDGDPPGYFLVSNPEAEPSDMEPNYAKPFKIASASAKPVVLTYYEAGESGKGVSDPAEDTTLHTWGLITCVGWLLFSDSAAYMTHIVVGRPLETKPDGIRKQVDSLYAQFEAESGGKAKACVIIIGPNPAYLTEKPREGALTWMNELQPTGCKDFWIEKGQTSWDRVVEASEKEQHNTKVWDGAPIKVIAADKDKSTEDTPTKATEETSTTVKEDT